MFLREIARISPVPPASAASRYVNAACSADSVRKLQLADTALHCSLPLLLIRSKRITPGTNLGNDKAFLTGRLYISVNQLLRSRIIHRKYHGAAAQLLHPARPLSGIVMFQ